MNFGLLLLIIIMWGSVSCQALQRDPGPINKTSSYIFKKPTADGTGKYYIGREIAQVMGASGAEWLERAERQNEENTALAIINMKLKPEAVVADIGAGTGYYSFRIASRVPRGKVYAVELQQELVDYLNKKKKETAAQNVEVVKGDTLQIGLPNNSLDLAIMVDVYHELAWPEEILQSISKCLKPEGKILLIEYRGEDPAVPIKLLHKTTVAQLSREMKINGFILEQKGDFLPIQHFLVFRKESKNSAVHSAR